MKKAIFILLFLVIDLHGQTENNEYYKKALKHASNKNIKEALNSINRAIFLEGNNAPSLFYFHKYEYLVKLQKFKSAIQVLNNALTIFPNSVLLLNARAEFYIALKEYKNSILDYKKIITLAKGKELIEYAIKLASTQFLIRDFEEAATIITKILKKTPSDIRALNLLAALYTELSNYTKAKNILLKLTKKHPSDLSTLINLGYVYQKENQHKEAILYFNRALKLNPNHPIGLSNRAYSKFKRSDIDGAMSDINKSINLLQSNSYAYMIRGKIYLSKHEPKKACTNFIIAKNLKFLEQHGTEVDRLIAENCE